MAGLSPDRLAGWRFVAAAAAAAFGAATIVSGGRVLFGPDAAREAAGDYVPFVVAANFAFGFGYLAAAGALALRRRAGVWLATALALGALLLLAAFGAHAARGGAWEARALGALVLRAAFWTALAGVAPRLVRRRPPAVA